MYEELLNLPEETGRLGTMVAISDLIHETERLEAARAAKEAELLELRAQTAELFGSALEAAGNDEGTVSAAKAMWERDPQTAAQAIAGCSIEDAVSAARGCNQYKHKPGCPEADENNPGEIKRNSGKRIVSRKIEKSFFFPTEDEARRFNIAKDTFLEELDPDGYLPETEYRNKKRYVVFGNLFIKNKESKGKMFTNLSEEDYRDLWNAENEVAGAYLDFNEHMTPDNLEAIMKREREYDKVRLKLEKKYLKD